MVKGIVILLEVKLLLRCLLIVVLFDLLKVFRRHNLMVSLVDVLFEAILVNQ